MNAQIFAVGAKPVGLRYSAAPKMWAYVPKRKSGQGSDIVLPTASAVERYFGGLLLQGLAMLRDIEAFHLLLPGNPLRQEMPTSLSRA
jgi:hypothetical protein